jgi:hypothetical protein
MSIRKGFKYILFSRMKDLIELPLPETQRDHIRRQLHKFPEHPASKVRQT